MDVALNGLVPLSAALIFFSLQAYADAYPYFWRDVDAAFMEGLSAGGPFGPMGIEHFESFASGVCEIGTGVSVYEAETTYNISLCSSVPVGHLIVASSGAFERSDNDSQFDGKTVYTNLDEKLTSKVWQWTSGSYDSVVRFYAVCATGKLGKASYATPLVLHRRILCAPSDAATITTPCQCSRTSATNECGRGRYCQTDHTCVRQRTRAQAMWLHALLTPLAWPLLVASRVDLSFLRRWRVPCCVASLVKRGMICVWLLVVMITLLAGIVCVIADTETRGAGGISRSYWLHGALGLVPMLVFSGACLSKRSESRGNCDAKERSALALAGVCGIFCVASGVIASVAVDLELNLILSGSACGVVSLVVALSGRLARAQQQCASHASDEQLCMAAPGGT